MFRRLISAITFVTILAFPIVGVAQDLVRIASPSLSLPHGALAMALVDSGIFENNDIGLVLRDTDGSSSECLRALQAQEVEICEVSTFSGLDAIADGADLQVVATLTGPISEILFAAKAVDALEIGTKPPLEARLDALEQARVATTAKGTTHYQVFATLLATEGRKIENIHMLSYESPRAMAEALRIGEADAIVWTTGEMEDLVAQGIALPWISLTRGDTMAMERLPFVSAFARREWIVANPYVVSRVYKSYARANRLLRIDPSAAARVRAELAPDYDWPRWKALFQIFRNAYLRRASTSKWNWDQLVAMRQKATGKDYTLASFERIVIPAARR